LEDRLQGPVGQVDTNELLTPEGRFLFVLLEHAVGDLEGFRQDQ
jgi:hypothetical protein